MYEIDVTLTSLLSLFASPDASLPCALYHAGSGIRRIERMKEIQTQSLLSMLLHPDFKG